MLAASTRGALTHRLRVPSGRGSCANRKARAPEVPRQALLPQRHPPLARPTLMQSQLRDAGTGSINSRPLHGAPSSVPGASPRSCHGGRQPCIQQPGRLAERSAPSVLAALPGRQQGHGDGLTQGQGSQRRPQFRWPNQQSKPHSQTRRPQQNEWSLQQKRQPERPNGMPIVDYAPSPTDNDVLKLPIKQELKPEQMTQVFGFPRDLRRRYDITKVLGAGSFGIVREAVDRETGRQYACKTVPKMPKRGKPTPRYLLKLQQEVDAMQQLGGSFDAVYLRDVFEDDSNIHMVMELCTGGSILESIKAGQPQTEADVADIIRCILRFIAQCHTKGIIYRDVKPDNFLYLTPDAASVKATDFGLSIRHWPGEPKLRSRSGTPVYMAPEVVLQEYDEQADVWSVGILMYQLLTGRFPFWEDIRNLSLQQVWQAILSQRIDLEAPELRSTSAAAKDLLRELLERDPATRFTPRQALNHPWIREPGVASLLPLDGSVVQRLQRFGTYSHLKQLVLRIITNEISGNDAVRKTSLDQLREMFENMDGDDSGSLSADELSKGLGSLGYTVSPMEFEKLVERLDLNDDGAINFDEFAASLVDWQMLQDDNLWAHWIDVAFGKMDVNGDGFISVDEIVSHMPGDNGDESERLVAISRAKRAMREADTNGDGMVSKEEFVHLLLGSPVSDSLDQYDARIAQQSLGK